MLFIIIISALLLSLIILGSIFIAPSWALGCYLSSVILILIGVFWVYFSLVYQRKQYAKKIHYRRDKIIKGGAGIKSVQPNKIIDPIFKYRLFPNQNHWFILICVISIIISLIPYQNWNRGEGIFDVISIFRMTMQMFVVDGGVSDFIQDSEKLPVMLNGIDGKGILLFNVYTALLCVITGLIFTFKLINIFAKEFKAYFDYWLWHPCSDIYVMSELNERSIILAESIFLKYYGEQSSNKQDKGEKKDLAKYARIYFCDVYSDNGEKNSELIYRAKRLGAVVMKKDIAEIKIKNFCRSNKFYLIGDSEEENVGQAQQICQSQGAKETKKELYVYIYATRSESELIIDDMHSQNNEQSDNEVESQPNQGTQTQNQSSEQNMNGEAEQTEDKNVA